MFDYIQISLWSLTYAIIVYTAIKCRQEQPLLMPLIPGCLNFSWEINALIFSKGFWGHILWLTLDIVIFSFNIINLKNTKNKIIYSAATVICTVVLALIFKFSYGMLISVFAIDLIMAICYIVFAKNISHRNKALIAFFKLLGDLFAWFAYISHTYVLIIGAIVFILNLFYLCYCLEESYNAKTKKSKTPIKLGRRAKK